MRKLLRVLRFPLRWIVELWRSRFPAMAMGSAMVERLGELKDKHVGEPVVLIGGGPSINKLDLSRLVNMRTIACNGFF